MGLESYFLHLLPESVEPTSVEIGNGFTATDFKGRSSVDVSAVIKEIKFRLAKAHLSNEFLPAQNKFIVDKAIEMSIDSEAGFFQKVTLAGCFSWYDPGLRLCYQLAQIVNDCVNVRAYHQSLETIPIKDEDAFLRAMQDIYQNQYQSFLKTFGEIKAKTLPGEDFYNYYRYSKSVLGRAQQFLNRLLN